MQEVRSTPTRLKCAPLTRAFRSSIAWSGILALCVSGCGLNSRPTSVLSVSDCVLNSDQGGTLSGRWLKTAVPIAFEQGAFNSTEIQAMINAAKTWNTFFAASMGYPAIDYGSDANPRTATNPLPTNSSDFCSNSADVIINDSDYTFKSGGVFVIYKDTSWPTAYGSTVIALTTTCRQMTAERKIPYFTSGYMEINYQNFFLNGNRVPDLQSIVLHEMGHLMGINHSCEANSTSPGIPDCYSPDLDPTYLHAVMYPSFSFSSTGYGELRRTLGTNDEERMNCVYKYL